jgi:hypothetical protein
MGVLSALIAYLEAPETVHPRQSSFHNPPVCAQFLAGLDAPPCYPRRYAPLPQSLAASREVVIFVGVQLHGAFARSPPRRLADGRDGVDRLLQNAGVVDVGRRVDHRERDAFSVDHNVALRARFALIRRIRAGLLAPREPQRSPSPRTPSPNLSGRLLPIGPEASDAAFPTHPPLATP